MAVCPTFRSSTNDGTITSERRINQSEEANQSAAEISSMSVYIKSEKNGIMHAMTISFFRVPWSARRPFHTSTTFSPKEVTLQCQKLILRTIRSQEMDEFPNPVSKQCADRYEQFCPYVSLIHILGPYLTFALRLHKILDLSSFTCG